MNHMMTPQQLLRNSEDRLRTATDAYEAANSRAERMSKRMHGGESVPDHRVDQAMRELRTARDVKERLEDEVAEMKREIARDEKIAEAQRDVYDTGVRRPAYDQVIRVGDPAMYTEHAERTGQRSFLHDLFAAQVLNDSGAHQRLAQHGRAMEATMSTRAVTTSVVPSFIPPAYATELFAEYARAGRPLANLLTPLPLPETGMTVTVPKVTTPSTVGVQSTQATTVSTQDLADTSIPVPIKTVAGYVPVARQALERGLMVEDLVFADLAGAYASQIDTLAITAALAQSDTNAVTYTDASPTVAEFWPKLADAVGKIRSGRFSGPTAMVLHPSTWTWLQAELSAADNRPLFVPTASAPGNAMGTQSDTGYGGAVGQILGVPVVLDANVPTNLGTGTNETCVLVADFRDSLIMEDNGGTPTQLRFEADAGTTLSINLVAYGYHALTFARQPKSISKITGTGMITPAL